MKQNIKRGGKETCKRGDGKKHVSKKQIYKQDRGDFSNKYYVSWGFRVFFRVWIVMCLKNPKKNSGGDWLARGFWYP